MPLIVRNISLSLQEDEERLRGKILHKLRLTSAELLDFRIVRKGIDARKKGNIRFIYTVEVSVADEGRLLARHGGGDLEQVPVQITPSFPKLSRPGSIVIVGTGPAGLFAALRLTEYGLVPTILERGKPVDERLADVQTFWSKGILDPESNVQFGEGGAGTFSDGKLTTRVRDDNIRYVLEKLVQFGAPADILWLNKPHIGTDLLREVVKRIRMHLQDVGCDMRFRRRFTGITSSGGEVKGVVVQTGEEVPCRNLLLAPGHSARDTYEMLHRAGVLLEAKPFAVGVRVEHPQELINRIQYGIVSHPRLPSADYMVTFNNETTRRSAYSFCMCPGGVIIASSSEPGGVVTNGMSAHGRNSPWANSALVVTVSPEDFSGSSPLAGIDFQRQWEMRAFEAGGASYKAPAQNMLHFLGVGKGRVSTSYLPGVVETDLAEVLPPAVTQTLREGIPVFDRRMRGFITQEATLVGVETRTSAPVRIVRGEDLQSVTLRGLYPAGEGAGYAGGIMSAALDGIRVADAIAKKHL